MKIKVSDFGLARVLEDGKDYYRMGQNGALPIRWMAVESIADFVFTTESDIVSFILFLVGPWSACLPACLPQCTVYVCGRVVSLDRTHLYPILPRRQKKNLNQ